MFETFGTDNIDYFDRNEREALALEHARENGLPEPELYQDKEIGIVWQPCEEWFNKVARLLELQLRMSVGMDMINDYQAQLDEWVERSKKGIWASKAEWNTVVARKSKLWKHWHALKDQGNNIVNGDKAIWGYFFKKFQREDKSMDLAAMHDWLIEYYEYASQYSESRYGIYGKTDEVDDMDHINNGIEEALKAIEESEWQEHLVHMEFNALREQRNYCKHVEKDISCNGMSDEEFDSLIESGDMF